MRDMTPEQRVIFVSSLHDKYCRHCGDEQPKTGSCQCWNDE